MFVSNSNVFQHLAAKHHPHPLFPHLAPSLYQVKIDYQPRAIKVRALQHGDYLELLNLFPLEGVHLTLEKLLLTGVSGWNGVMQVLLQVIFSRDVMKAGRSSSILKAGPAVIWTQYSGPSLTAMQWVVDRYLSN